MTADVSSPDSAQASLVERMIRPEVRALSRYHLELAPCRHKLDQNEVPFELPRAMKRRIAEGLVDRAWAKYPDFHADGLRQRLSERFDWPFEGVLVGNGSNELLGLVLEAIGGLVTGAGDEREVLGADPSFGLYRMFAVRAGWTPRFRVAGTDLQLPLDALEVDVERDPRRPLILCTPNNPTGEAVDPARVERLLERLEAPLLLDCAYAEFCRHDYRPLLDRYRHLVLFRTFSKAWSLGGVRLGYLLADPELVTEWIKVKLPYNVGVATAAIGEAVLDHPEPSQRRLRAILARRPQWASMLRARGLEVWESEANFHLARVPEGVDAVALQAALEARGIRVRNVGKYPRLAGCLRVSVGSGAALRAVDEALGELLPAPPPSITTEPIRTQENAR